MDRDTRIRMYAKMMARLVLIIGVVTVVIFIPFILYLHQSPIAMIALVTMILGIILSGYAHVKSPDLPALNFRIWVAGTLLIVVGMSVADLDIRGISWRGLGGLALEWVVFGSAIALNVVAVRKGSSPNAIVSK